jgi:RES domain-containing protein
VIPLITEIAQQRTVRLIPTAYYKPPVLTPLVDNGDELAILADIEGMTSKRLTDGNLGVAFDYDAWGKTFISAAFTYCRVGGNRFNDETRGAWYAAFEDQTALEEVAFHKTRELSYIDHFFDEVEYRGLHASFIGRFHDIRSILPPHPCLDPDTEIGYREGQALAKTLVDAGSRGLIYPSVRKPGGICLVAFQPNAVQDVTPGSCWRLTWAGSPAWTATVVAA